jgi:hypothetical protein
MDLKPLRRRPPPLARRFVHSTTVRDEPRLEFTLGPVGGPDPSAGEAAGASVKRGPAARRPSSNVVPAKAGTQYPQAVQALPRWRLLNARLRGHDKPSGDNSPTYPRPLRPSYLGHVPARIRRGAYAWRPVSGADLIVADVANGIGWMWRPPAWFAAMPSGGRPQSSSVGTTTGRGKPTLRAEDQPLPQMAEGGEGRKPRKGHVCFPFGARARVAKSRHGGRSAERPIE